jgi:hypothetical protein
LFFGLFSVKSLVIDLHRHAAGGTMMEQALEYFMHYGPSAVRFELAGDLNDEGACQLDQDWRTASAVIGDRALIVDLTFLTGAEAMGRTLLARWYAAGAQLIAQSNVSRKLAEAIIGKPLPALASAHGAGVDRTWLPFRMSTSANWRRAAAGSGRE